MNGWGNSYDIKPNKKTAPLHVNYAMRCEYPDYVAVHCLCPGKDPPEGGAQICSKKVRRCDKYLDFNFGGFVRYKCKYSDREWGKYNYSSPQYCTKLDVIIDRPLGSMCSEHAHCAVGLECSSGVCSLCPGDACPDRTPSDELSSWGKTCSYGRNNCPHAWKGNGRKCNPHTTGADCCGGLTCDSESGKCIPDDGKVDGNCTEDDGDICRGYFCLENKVVNGEGREWCYIEDNGLSSNCSISGTFCDVESNTCYRSYDKPRQIYKPHNSECKEHFDCDKGLYCNGGICSACQVNEECPEKGNPNFNTCKRGEYGRPRTNCVTQGGARWPEWGTNCCGGLKCDEGSCVIDKCKKTGTCDDDSDLCDGYGCVNGNVVHAVGQKCYSENG